MIGDFIMNKKGLMFLAVAPLMAYALMSFNEPVTLEARDADLLIELKDENYSVKEREEIQKEFIHELNTVLDFNYRVVGTYSYANNVINIKLPSSKIELVKSMSLVEKANLNAFHKADSFISDSFRQIYHPLLNAGESKTVPSENYSAKQMNVPTSNKGGQGTFLAILDSSFLLTHEGFSPLSGNVRYSEADMKTKVSTNGFYGAPDATHTTYYNSKVPFYYDYGGDSVVSETVPPTPDYDVFTKLSEHGQHVSTLCAGNGSYKGIAPNAQLALMKVFTTYTVKDQSSVGALDSAILNALNDCAVIGVDGINLSLGSFISEYSADDVISSTMKKLNDAGTNINISAGNEGKGNFSSLAVYSNFTTGNVETGVSGGFATIGNTNVIASGNLTDDEGLSSSLTVGDTFISYHDQVVNHTGKDADGNESTTTFTKQLPFSSLLGTAESKEFDFVNVPNYGQEADYASIDVKGKIAVVSRGTSTFVDKVTQASKHGAIGFILYNSADQGDLGWMVLDGVAESDLIPVASCDNLYKNTFLDSKTLKVKISKDYQSDYSSEGGSSKLEINVDITTPGQNVYDGLTASDTDYGYMSGTSMAAPNYTGALAVILGESGLSGENRTNYSKKLAMITQSTSNPIMQGNGVYYSPRKVGAGYIDVTKALNSDVYLEGTSANETKVELLNGDEVKKGELKFSVKTHNTSTSTKAYKGTLYVEAPLTTTLDKVSLPQFNGATVKTQYDKLLESYSFDVNVPAGDSSFDVDHVISEASKTYLDSNFENGTYLGGYVGLEGDVDLSIPYLGFYGDYSKEFAVEPYNFEKEDGKVYGSDLLNYLCKNTTLGVTAADFSSAIYASSKELKDFSTKDYFQNAKDPSILYTTPNVVLKDGKYYVYAGNNGVTNTLLFNQYVNRTVLTNTITMTNSAGKTVLTDHMYDSISGGTDFYTLYKTMADVTLAEEKYVAHRAYTIIPLSSYADGTYNMHFEYTLMNGTVQSRDIGLIIDSTIPPVGRIETSGEGTSKNYKIAINGNNISGVTIGEDSYEIKDGYIDVPASKLTSSRFKLVAANLSLGSCTAIIDTGNLGDNGLFISKTDDSGVGGYKYTTTTVSNGVQ